MRSIKFDSLQPKPDSVRPRPSREIAAAPAGPAIPPASTPPQPPAAAQTSSK